MLIYIQGFNAVLFGVNAGLSLAKGAYGWMVVNILLSALWVCLAIAEASTN